MMLVPLQFYVLDERRYYSLIYISRFQLYYYSDAEFKKEERKDTVLTIDTRTKIDKISSNKDEMDDGDLDDDLQEPPLQLAIKTK